MAYPIPSDSSACNPVNIKNPVYSGGATGNGVTDDTAAVQAAINAAANTRSGVVFFPPGAYLCQPLTIPPAVILQGVNGEGYLDLSTTIANTNTLSRILLKPGSTSALISPYDGGINKATLVQIRDLMLDCNGIAQAAVNLPDQDGGLGRFWNFERVYVTNTSQSDNGACIYVGVNNNGCNFRDCYIYNGQSGSAAGCIGLAISGHDSNVDHCWIGFWGEYGFALTGGNSSMSCNVRGGGIFGNGYGGILAGGSGLVIDGASIDGNATTGIYVAYGTSPPTTISNCEFHGNGTSGGPNIYLANNDLVLNLLGNYAYDDGSTPKATYMVQVDGTGCIINQACNYAPSEAFGTAWTNYDGTISAPSFPGSTVAAVNSTGADVQAFIANGADAITAIELGTTMTGLTIGGGDTAAIRIPNGQSITFTYAGGSPSWTWVVG